MLTKNKGCGNEVGLDSCWGFSEVFLRKCPGLLRARMRGRRGIPSRGADRARRKFEAPINSERQTCTAILFTALAMPSQGLVVVGAGAKSSKTWPRIAISRLKAKR